MPKEILRGQLAREALQRGVNEIGNTVGTTQGPKGRNVALEKKFGSPTVTHDGVTVAKEIELQDPFENLGAQVVKEAAIKTNEEVGDGTTTATVLAQALVNEGMAAISAGENAMVLRRKLESQVGRVVKEIEKLSKPVNSKKERAQIATISSADPKIGDLIGEAMEKVGVNGIITVEEGQELETKIEYTEGTEIDRGFVSTYFLDDSSKGFTELDEPYILLCDGKIVSDEEITPIILKVKEQRGSLLVVAEEIEGRGLAAVLAAKVNGHVNTIAVKRPGIGNIADEFMQDLAVITGATIVSDRKDMKLQDIGLEVLGRAEKVRSTIEKTTIIEAKGAEEARLARIKQVEELLKVAESPNLKLWLKERLNRLSQNIAVIKVGASTEVERNERRMRVEDAVLAAKAASESGVVAGGETTLIRASLSAKVDPMVVSALSEPFRRLILNAGYNLPIRMTNLLRSSYPFGIDVTDGKLKNLFTAGIIDPAKVPVTALKNALSVAVMVLTTEDLVIEARTESGAGQICKFCGRLTYSQVRYNEKIGRFECENCTPEKVMEMKRSNSKWEQDIKSRRTMPDGSIGYFNTQGERVG